MLHGGAVLTLHTTDDIQTLHGSWKRFRNAPPYLRSLASTAELADADADATFTKSVKTTHLLPQTPTNKFYLCPMF